MEMRDQIKLQAFGTPLGTLGFAQVLGGAQQEANPL